MAPVCTTVSISSLRLEAAKTASDLKEMKADTDRAIQVVEAVKTSVSLTEAKTKSLEETLSSLTAQIASWEKRAEDLAATSEALQKTLKTVEDSMAKTEARLQDFNVLEKKFGLMETAVQDALVKIDQKADASTVKVLASKLEALSDSD